MSEFRRTELTGVGGLQNFVFPFGEQLSAEKFDDVSIQFQYDFLDEPRFVTTGVTATGTVGVEKSVAFCNAPAVGDVAWIESRDSIRYRPGHSGYIDLTLGVDDSLGGFGHGGGFNHDMENGFIIHIEGGELYFGFLKDGVMKGSNFSNGLDLVTNHGLILQNLNIYRIVFGYLGIVNPTLFVRVGGAWKLLHEVDTEGKGVDTHTSTPVFPMCIMAHGGAKVYTGSWNGGVIGNGSSVGNIGMHFPTQTLIGAGPYEGQVVIGQTAPKTMVIFRAKDTFKTKKNNIKAKLTGYTFTVDIPAGNNYGDVIFQLVFVQSLSGVPTYTPISIDGSVMEYNHTPVTGASVSVTAGVPITQEVISYTGASKGGSAGKAIVDADQIGAYAYAGDTFAVIARNIGNVDVTARVSVNWEELF